MTSVRRIESEVISTNLTNAVTKHLGTMEARLGYIEILVVIVALWHVTLVVIGKMRPRRKSGFLKGLSFLSFAAIPYLIAYAFGLMQDSPFHTEFFPFWAISLVYVLGSPDSFSVYAVDDNDQNTRVAFQYGMKIGALGVLLSFTTHPFWSFLLFAPVILTLAPSLRIWGRLASLFRSSQASIEESHKMTLEYLTSESVLSGLRRADPVTMKGYNFLVSWRPVALWPNLRTERAAAPTYQRQFNDPNNDAVTVDRVWNCKGQLLSSRRGRGDPDCRLKDMLLSLSLLRLLILRYARYALPEEVRQRMWDLICRGALRDHRRTHRVIEIELALLFDFFYTDYSAVFSRAVGIFRFAASAITFGVSIALVCHLGRRVNPQETVRMPTIGGNNINVLVTYLVAVVLLVAETMQLALLCFSRWTKIMLLLFYASNETSYLRMKWLEKIVGWICIMPQPKPWERKLRQYSLLRAGKKEGHPMKFPEEVTSQVLDSLTRNGQKLCNGAASLRRNKVSDQLGWACMLETPTHVIMVWHVATSFCEFHLRDREDLDNLCRKDKVVSLSLSGYLAYLVAFAPRLLPGHPYNTKHVFNNVVFEARKVFNGGRTDEERVEKLEEITNRPDETIVNRGARLGKMILDELGDPARVWKLLAEFWAEMMLYVAPSDDFKAHLEEVANGGQFVTHVWALLWHAGVERDEASSTVKQGTRRLSIWMTLLARTLSHWHQRYPSTPGARETQRPRCQFRGKWSSR